MKKTFVVLFFACILIFGLSAAAPAATGRIVQVKVPFAFEAGDTLMPAGEYRFEMVKSGGSALGSMLRITSADGSVCQHLLSRTILGVDTSNDWHLSFAKYGNSYYLSKVRNRDLGAEISKSNAEKQLESEFQRSQKPIGFVEIQASYSRVK